mmetsp:Transcript_75636/g.227062  ORF Transcript_75636/g.227062 Transcript_75636/m.227062 type:complete len:212 (+) Transcript_75636:347-982(+)
MRIGAPPTAAASASSPTAASSRRRLARRRPLSTSSHAAEPWSSSGRTRCRTRCSRRQPSAWRSSAGSASRWRGARRAVRLSRRSRAPSSWAVRSSLDRRSLAVASEMWRVRDGVRAHDKCCGGVPCMESIGARGRGRPPRDFCVALLLAQATPPPGPGQTTGTAHDRRSGAHRPGGARARGHLEGHVRDSLRDSVRPLFATVCALALLSAL